MLMVTALSLDVRFESWVHIDSLNQGEQGQLECLFWVSSLTTSQFVIMQ